MTDTFDCRKAIVTSEDIDVLAGALGSNTSDDVVALVTRLQLTLASYEPDAVERAQAIYSDTEAEAEATARRIMGLGRRVTRYGTLKIDEGATCSRGDDSGLYIQAWVWLEDEEETGK